MSNFGYLGRLKVKILNYECCKGKTNAQFGLFKGFKDQNVSRLDFPHFSVEIIIECLVLIFSSRNVPDRPFKCALCPSSTFATSDNLKKHVDNKHCPGHSSGSGPESQDEAEATPLPLHSCSSSSFSTATAAAGGAVASAAMTSEPESTMPFKCHLCDEGYGERSDVLTHLQASHAEEYRSLVSKGALSAAASAVIATSDENDDYESVRGKFPDYVNRKVTCAFCLRRFWSAEDLRRHMRTHTGERPFQCDVCARRFTLKHSMLRHRRKHDAANDDEDEEDEDDDEEEEVDDEEEEPSEDEEDEEGQRRHKLVRMQAKMLKMRPCGSDLIGNLLGLPDASLVEQLMSKPADDAARLLGVTDNRV